MHDVIDWADDYERKLVSLGNSKVKYLDICLNYINNPDRKAQVNGSNGSDSVQFRLDLEGWECKFYIPYHT